MHSSGLCKNATGSKRWDTDFNNNPRELDNKSSEDTIPEPRHSKFCHSKDISEKEESLRNCRVPATAPPMMSYENKEKKTVTFDNTFPVYLDINKERRRVRDIEWESDEDYLETGFADASSETDLLSPSGSECWPMSKPQEKAGTIQNAEVKLTTVLNRLQAIWLDVNGTERDPKIVQPVQVGENNLTEIVGLISFVTEQLHAGYRKLANPANMDTLVRLESRNQFLEEELKSFKMMKTCLEAEINYLSKEKNLLNDEVKFLTYKMASGSNDLTLQPKAEEKVPKTEVFYRNPHQRFEQTDSNSSALMSTDGLSEPPKSNQGPTAGDESKIVFQNAQTLNGLLDLANLRGTEISCLHSKLQNYDTEINGLRKLICSTNHEKQELLVEFERLIEEQKALLRERDHYESILKLILKEKTSSDFDLQDLLKHLIAKLNAMSIPTQNTDMRSPCQTSLLEGAIQTVQEQNATQREEIAKLKEQLSIARSENTKQTELESAQEQLSKKLEELTAELQAKKEELKLAKDDADKKYKELEELYTTAISTKADLEKSISDKEEELKSIKEKAEKDTVRKSNKINNLHKTNIQLVKEIEELKHNMEQLASIISQLRCSLKESKSQWNERLRIATNEVAQSKEHCRWLQSQIEHMNEQLSNAHERIKAHETDRTHLAQQCLLAEEERQIVDRKLQELRSALQGDTVLREALLERNETLQFEINRLRRSKLASLAGGNALTSTNGGQEPPPSEMSKVEDPMSIIQPTDHNHNNIIVKKNRYMLAGRRGNEVPRTAVSLHNGGSVQGD